MQRLIASAIVVLVSVLFAGCDSGREALEPPPTPATPGSKTKAQVDPDSRGGAKHQAEVDPGSRGGAKSL